MALVDRSGMVGKRSVAHLGVSGPVIGSGLGKRAAHARYWPAVLITLIVVPMVVVLGFYAMIPAKASGPAPVDLLTSGDFVILSMSGISTTGTTNIVGDIGVSPAAASYITGFDLVADASNVFSTSIYVTGSVYAADYAPPTPARLTTAVSDMQAAYSDAAGRAPDFTELYGGNLTGQVLTPGCYMWSTGVEIGTAGVTILGGASDTWIFQIAGTLNLSSGAAVTLGGGALAANIVWQVAGETTLATSSVMKGIILDQTAIVIMTGASLEGRALSQTAVTLDADTVYTPGIVIPEFGQVMIPLVGMMFVAAIAGIVRNQRK